MDKPFIGRKWELKRLLDLHESNRAQFVVIKGRRRIGKSTLIQEFARRSPQSTKFISLSGQAPAPGVTAQDQRDDFAEQLARIFHTIPPKSESWGDLFWQLAQHTRTGSYIILLDEISWMGMQDPTFLGKLKTAWDQHFKENNQLILVVCGSISSWIDQNLLKNTGFVGRVDMILTLEELSISESVQMFGKLAKQLSPHELFKILSVTGGVPRYLEAIQPQYSAEENLKSLCFTPGGFLFHEFEQIFHDLFSSRNTVYQQLLQALITSPRASLEELFNILKIEKSGTYSEYLNDLAQAGFISRDYTWDLRKEKKSLLSQYRISDNYVRFYLKYVAPIKDKIAKGDFKDRSLTSLPGWDTIMGLQFENMVIKNRKIIHTLLNIDPGDIIHDGPYFQRQTTKHDGCQIDYMIQTRFNSYIPCEIKFSRDPIGVPIVEEMRKRVNALNIPRHASCRPVLIHVNGIDERILGEEFFAKVIDFSQMLAL